MTYNFVEAVSPVGFELDLDDLLKTGRMASVLCRLARDGFTGVLYVDHDESGGGIFSFRDGKPVFVEDLGDGPSLPDQILERGLVNQTQYAEIAERVTEALVESEDVAFCQVAVEVGALTQEKVDELVGQRNRGRLIQAVGWQGCEMEADADPDGLAGILEYPEDVGAIVYMGVRTFFDDEQVRSVLGPASQYARLNVPAATVAGFFGFEEEEAALLHKLRPDMPIEETIREVGCDPLEGWQTMAMLLMSGMGDLAASPFEVPAETSGMRDTSALRGGHPRGDGAAVEEQNSMARQRPAMRPPSRPSVREERVFIAREERVGPSRSPRRSAPQASPAEPVRPSAARPAQAPAPQSAPQPASPVIGDEMQIPAEPAPPEPERRDSIAARMKERRRRQRKLGAALKRLDRELKERRPQPTAERRASVSVAVPQRAARAPAKADKPAAAASDAAAAQKKADRAHVKALMRMRQAQKTNALNSRRVEPAASPKEERGATVSARDAERALLDQQYDKAHDMFKELALAEPDNERHKPFLLYAALRCQRATDEDLKELRKALRDLTNDDELKGFAAHALGHLALSEKKDDQAEKYFRKATELDKRNKDAERHLRILELKRKTAAQEKNANKIFGIEITRKKS